MLDRSYTGLALRQAMALLAIDSPTGFTEKAAQWVQDAFAALGYDARRTVKGGVLIDLGGKNADDALLLEAHTDTLGGMVTQITDGGRLKLTALGGMDPNNAEGENVRIYTREGKVYTGTFQLHNASIHVNGNYDDTKRSYEDMEVVIDEEVRSKADAAALGILPGDVVCFEPRTVVTPSGYIKSRFLDDKLSVGVLLPWPGRSGTGR